jgi:hypothetical protein
MSIGIYEGMELVFTHLPTGKTVRFLAYLENLADMYSSTWHAEDVYGRMDPIVNFINTRRSFSVTWNIPANSFADDVFFVPSICKGFWRGNRYQPSTLDEG